MDRRGGRAGISSAARSASRSGDCSEAAPTGCLPTPPRASSSTRPNGRAASSLLRDRRRQGGEDPLPRRRLAPGRRGRGSGARRCRLLGRDHGRREPGLADAGRSRAALGRSHGRAVRRRARAARRLLARGAAADATTSTAMRAQRARTTLRLAAGRWRVAPPRRATSSCAAASTCCRRDVVLAGGIGGCRRIAALADLCGRAWSPHTWTNGVRAGRQPAPGVRRLHVPVHRGALRPACLDGRAARLAAAGADRDRPGRHDCPAHRPRPRRRARPGRPRGLPGRMNRPHPHPGGVWSALHPLLAYRRKPHESRTDRAGTVPRTENLS